MLGICNGFQILVEAGLLPGALLRNAGPEIHLPRRRICASKPPTRRSPHGRNKGQILRMPDRPRRRLLLRRRAHARRARGRGPRSPSATSTTPTARMRDIAGILNRERNVMGMMPHPERAAEPLMGSTDGLVILQLDGQRAGGARMTTCSDHSRTSSRSTSSRRPSTRRSSRSSAASRATPSSASSA